jgi:hypothetical protein
MIKDAKPEWDQYAHLPFGEWPKEMQLWFNNVWNNYWKWFDSTHEENGLPREGFTAREFLCKGKKK